MNVANRLLLARMADFADRWEGVDDRRCIFLRCYAMMTGRMLDALDAGRFADGAWVLRLLERFAEYYFDALACYEARRTEVPSVWLLAHDAAQRETTLSVQHLMVGVNAHINYDLVFALSELLAPEWERIGEAERARRHADYDQVNAIIGETIDQVQDDVLEARAPLLDLIDTVMGPVDEWMISHLITHWRDTVWRHAILHVESSTPEGREQLRQAVEVEAMRTGKLILGKW